MRRSLAAAIGLASIAAAAVAHAEPPPGAVACSGCHPASPRVISPVPRLATMDRAAIGRALLDFKAGRRAATVMDRIAKGFSDEEIQALAAWLGAKP